MTRRVKVAARRDSQPVLVNMTVNATGHREGPRVRQRLQGRQKERRLADPNDFRN